MPAGAHEHTGRQRIPAREGMRRITTPARPNLANNANVSCTASDAGSSLSGRPPVEQAEESRSVSDVDGKSLLMFEFIHALISVMVLLSAVALAASRTR